MLILALDTSATASSCCLYEDSSCVSEFILNTKTTHSKTAMPMIDALLASSGKAISDIDVFAVSAGPGSFTGVRIGVSVVLGLSFGKSAAIGVSTLAAAAYNVCDLSSDHIICPVMDARRGQFYTALFLPGEHPQRLTEDLALSYTELQDLLLSKEKPVIFVGDGAAVAKRLMPDVPTLKIPERCVMQNAHGVAKEALRLYNDTPDRSVFLPENLKPVYLRPSQAERNLNNKSSEE